jgi:hypothetical protein
MPRLVPSRAAGGAGQRIALGLAAQFVDPCLPQSMHGGVLHHRGLLGTELSLVPTMPLSPGSADQAIAQYLRAGSV